MEKLLYNKLTLTLSRILNIVIISIFCLYFNISFGDDSSDFSFPATCDKFNDKAADGTIESYKFAKCLSDSIDKSVSFHISGNISIERMTPYASEINDEDKDKCSKQFSIKSQGHLYDRCLKSTLQYKTCINKYIATLYRSLFVIKRKCMAYIQVNYPNALTQNQKEQISFPDGKIIAVDIPSSVSNDELNYKKSNFFDDCMGKLLPDLRDQEINDRIVCNKILIDNNIFSN